MKEHEKDVLRIKSQLQANCKKLTDYEALDIATKMQYNEHIREAFVIGYTGVPSALEALVMKLDLIASALGSEHKLL